MKEPCHDGPRPDLVDHFDRVVGCVPTFDLALGERVPHNEGAPGKLLWEARLYVALAGLPCNSCRVMSHLLLLGPCMHGWLAELLMGGSCTQESACIITE